ncbi:hypothetical protein GCM10023230_18160 [Flavobacterium hankyongi]|uniref:Uncharacterized protein n=1 Tax=Flavobacterium hankyongi TaxID=1176532 RepID=A0ABP8ZYG2_9FLAO
MNKNSDAHIIKKAKASCLKKVKLNRNFLRLIKNDLLQRYKNTKAISFQKK